MIRRACSGFTIVELTVAGFLLGLLTVLAFGTYTLGARAWAKGDAESELLRNAQIVSAKTARLAESSTGLSVSISEDGTAAAFLSAEDENGVFQYNPTSFLPRWQKYIVLYHLPDQSTVYIREVSVLGTDMEANPLPIDALGNGPVANYASQGKPLALGVDECRFSLTPDGQLLTEVASSMMRYGSREPERQSARVINTFRN